MTSSPRSVWGPTFDDISRKRGDTEAANSYVSVRNFRFLRNEVLRHLGDVKHKRILDVGCGTGHFSQPLVRENFIVGIDFSPNMLAFARNKGLAVVQGPAENLPFKSGSFDVVFANSVIQLIPDGSGFLMELVRAVRPGGRIIISTINDGNVALAVLRRVERKKYRHFRLYPFDELKALVAAAGGEMRTSLFLYFPFGRTRTIHGHEGLGVSPRRFATSVVVEAVRPK
ncbi:MAG: methyltransferase domain-containing protein [Candidatus Aminicenantes bacterium]|nr:methyltransferase domain-containing protein [Candidatus Aminicenantes bacterium]